MVTRPKPGSGIKTPPARHTAANSDTLHDTPAQRAVQVSGCGASREWRGAGEGEGGQRSENPLVVKAAVCPERIDCDHMDSSVNGGI